MPDHPHPLPGWLQFIVERNAGRTPLWQFPALRETPALSFERLHFDNRQAVLDMFEADPDRFVANDFKSAKALYEYVAVQWICGPYSPKHGRIDWIVHAEGREPAGLLHLYDVSRETWALNHRWCTIGYAVAERFRGTGLAQQAVRALQNYAFGQLDMLMLLAMPDKLNERSARFLLRLGYEERTERYCGKHHFRFFELYRDTEAQRTMEGRYGSEVR